MALVGTFAWFIYDKSATVTTEDKAKIVAGEYMEIKLKGTDEWVSEIELAADLQYPDISYDYDSKEFYYPSGTYIIRDVKHNDKGEIWVAYDCVHYESEKPSRYPLTKEINKFLDDRTRIKNITT
mgnify:CR=1 FL=1